MKAAEQYFPMVLFVILYNAILIFESVDEIFQIFKCDIQMKACEQHFCGFLCFSELNILEPPKEILKRERSIYPSNQIRTKLL